MYVAFPEMMSWNVYFFYFKLSDNNAEYFENEFLLRKKQQ